MIWRERKWILIILGVILLANIIFFFTYRVRYEARVNDLDRRLDQAGSELVDARRERLRLEERMRIYRENVDRAEEVRQTHWSTREQRLTALIVEIRRLANRSGVGMPRSISYGVAEVDGPRDVIEMSIGFSVRGSYRQIRELINLIENSEQFVIIDEIALSSADSGAADEAVQLNIRLKTLFRDPDATAGGPRS